VIKAGHLSLELVHPAKSYLYGSGIKVMGAILNQVKDVSEYYT
jgi:hypothetical protein